MGYKIVNPLLSAAGAVACGAAGYAAGAVICGAAGYIAARMDKAGIKNVEKNTGEGHPDEPGRTGKGIAGGISIKESQLDENKVRRCLLNLFWMYDYGEFKKFRGCTNDDTDLREYAAGYYAPALYEYMQGNMETVFKMDGDDGTGKEPFEMSDTLFYAPACRICSVPEEVVADCFWLLQEKEVWMLEDGRTAAVYCLSFEKDGWQLIYRFLDKFIQMPGDMTVPFGELECGLVRMMGLCKKH